MYSPYKKFIISSFSMIVKAKALYIFKCVLLFREQKEMKNEKKLIPVSSCIEF